MLLAVNNYNDHGHRRLFLLYTFNIFLNDTVLTCVIVYFGSVFDILSENDMKKLALNCTYLVIAAPVTVNNNAFSADL